MPRDLRAPPGKDTTIKLADGSAARVSSEALPNATAVTITVETTAPVFLRLATPAMRRNVIEMVMADGCRYWAEEFDVFRRYSRLIVQLGGRAHTEMEEGTRPGYVVCTDGGTPGVVIIAGYIAMTEPGSFSAYTSDRIRIARRLSCIELAMAHCAYTREISSGDRR